MDAMSRAYFLYDCPSYIFVLSSMLYKGFWTIQIGSVNPLNPSRDDIPLHLIRLTNNQLEG